MRDRCSPLRHPKAPIATPNPAGASQTPCSRPRADHSITDRPVRPNSAYSAFIVADRVTVTSRRAGLPPEEGVRFESDGQGEYTLHTLQRKARGTGAHPQQGRRQPRIHPLAVRPQTPALRSLGPRQPPRGQALCPAGLHPSRLLKNPVL
jgi:hypothetical protein